MRRAATLLPALLLPGVLLLGGCGDGSLVPAAGESTVTDEGTSEPATETPSAEASATPAEPTAPADPSSTPPAVPSAVPSATPSAAPSASGPSQALASVRRDVAEVAPALERFYTDREYPLDLAQVRSTLAEAGVRLTAGNTVAGYAYDGDAVEFELCVQSASGAWATYDTAPMTTGGSGETGGCPAG